MAHRVKSKALERKLIVKGSRLKDKGARLTVQEIDVGGWRHHLNFSIFQPPRFSVSQPSSLFAFQPQNFGLDP
jgi:hypothetical protein